VGRVVLLESSLTARAIDTATLPEDTVREAIEHIAANLRPADKAEIEASLGDDVDPFWTLFESWDFSIRSWLIVDETGLPIGIFGVAPFSREKVGVAWLLGTPGMEEAAYSVARQTRRYIREMHEAYPILWANVDARNELSMKWLAWAGFGVVDANPAFGPQKRLFLEFLRTR
jgi:hypothetical protein